MHSELNSNNIFCTADGTLKLGGFFESSEYFIQKCLAFYNIPYNYRPYFRAPEIIKNENKSYKADIWSLGVILYEMAALKPPFQAECLI